jgi:hypothetical protein
MLIAQAELRELLAGSPPVRTGQDAEGVQGALGLGKADPTDEAAEPGVPAKRRKREARRAIIGQIEGHPPEGHPQPTSEWQMRSERRGPPVRAAHR